MPSIRSMPGTAIICSKPQRGCTAPIHNLGNPERTGILLIEIDRHIRSVCHQESPVFGALAGNADTGSLAVVVVVGGPFAVHVLLASSVLIYVVSICQVFGLPTSFFDNLVRIDVAVEIQVQTALGKTLPGDDLCHNDIIGILPFSWCWRAFGPLPYDWGLNGIEGSSSQLMVGCTS
jgi:hypothetical protein